LDLLPFDLLPDDELLLLDVEDELFFDRPDVPLFVSLSALGRRDVPLLRIALGLLFSPNDLGAFVFLVRGGVDDIVIERRFKRTIREMCAPRTEVSVSRCLQQIHNQQVKGEPKNTISSVLRIIWDGELI
jgi:hypothetical protein